MKSDFTQEEIENLTPEEYSNFIAFGEIEVPLLTEEEYERYLLSHLEYDL